jgi:hypothetical protein
MIAMNPYYAYPSSVGPVFDVATWSTRKIAIMVMVALLLATGLTLGGLYFWNPKLFAEYLPKGFEEVAKGVLDLHRKYAWSRYAGTAVFGLLGYYFFAGTIACLRDLASGNFYFRAGPGGIVIRVPNGLDATCFGLKSKIVSFELPWDRIAMWNIVQQKGRGAISRNSGNFGGYLALKTFDGGKYTLSLNYFREPPVVVGSKIKDAVQMVPASWEDPTGEDREAIPVESN